MFFFLFFYKYAALPNLLAHNYTKTQICVDYWYWIVSDRKEGNCQRHLKKKLTLNVMDKNNSNTAVYEGLTFAIFRSKISCGVLNSCMFLYTWFVLILSRMKGYCFRWMSLLTQTLQFLPLILCHGLQAAPPKKNKQTNKQTKKKQNNNNNKTKQKNNGKQISKNFL